MRPMSRNSFSAAARLDAGGTSYEIFRLDALSERRDIATLPFSLKILLENLLRNEDGVSVTAEAIEALATWDPTAEPDREIAFMPARVLMQDLTGVPCVVDLAAMRDAMVEIGGDPSKTNPLIPAELVIDHSIHVDVSGVSDAFARNVELEYQRNRERYEFLRWGQAAFSNFKVVPPNTGICHQVNLEYLARVVFTDPDTGRAYPDTLVGTDSHTPMVNGLGVVGWGVGGIEAEAAMLGQPIPLLIPKVVGCKLTGHMPEGATATDLVLTITERLRQHGVVGKFVEFYGPGVANVPLADRATIGNMSPEYGSTITIFPIDAETLRYLEFSGRAADHIALVESYAREQGLWHDESSPEPRFSERLELDLSTVEPSLAGPSRPQDRVPLRSAKPMFRAALLTSLPESVQTKQDEASDQSFPASDPPAAASVAEASDEVDEGADVASTPTSDVRPKVKVPVRLADGTEFDLDHGHVVIAAITSCTNTSNPYVMLGAGLLAKKAVEKGLDVKPWVKTSLAPGSKVVMDYYERAGLLPYLDKLRFNLVGFGCTTCIGNSGPLPPEISEAVDKAGLAVVSVLSGNRNFEGRVNPDTRMNYLASPPLVVAYALAGTMDIDLYSEPIGTATDGSPVFLRDIWPSTEEVRQTVDEAVASDMFRKSYAEVFAGDERWNALDVPTGDQFAWDPQSTYVRKPPYFDGMPLEPAARTDVIGARVLAVLGDSVTTDHISPAGSIRKDSPAARWLNDWNVDNRDFNSYGARRGNHEVMIRGTFANPRIKNRLLDGVEGGYSKHQPDGEEGSIYDVSMRYQSEGTPLVIFAGKEYGSGSSRDWAAKGTALLGVKAVIAESYERIHRSNLIGMGVLPLQFLAGDSVAALELSGDEVIDVLGVGALSAGGAGAIPETLEVRINGGERTFSARLRIDTPKEAEYYRHGGILPYVLRQLRG